MKKLKYGLVALSLVISNLCFAQSARKNVNSPYFKPSLSKGESINKKRMSDPRMRSIQEKRNAITKLQNEISSLEKVVSNRRISHEVYGSINFSSKSGSIQDAESAKATEINRTSSEVALSYGYFFGDHLEPVIELSQRSVTQETAAATATDSRLNATLGLLVNLPIADNAFSGNKVYHAKWIPYMGFLISSESDSSESGIATTTEFKNSQVTSKLMFGSRYKLFENVAVNFNMRLSYESKDEKASTDSQLGSNSAGTNIEATILGISLLLSDLKFW